MIAEFVELIDAALEECIMKTHRLARVSEVIREVASETILFELRDPRVKMVTVTRAEVSGDLQHAKVYVSIMGSEQEQKVCLYGLRRAAGFIQSKLAERMQTRFVPTLEFVQDLGLKNSIEVARLLAEEKRYQKPETVSETEPNAKDEQTEAPVDEGE
jgi:ribosome-binding factor A